MTTRLADPGRRVGSGRLRVDAARAIAKLREYQLPDRTMWVLEAIRAAVAAPARRIELDGDSDDVWLAWEGEPWPAEVVTRLFDELVSPSPARDAAPYRLLATAVNSALGMDPSYVDVFAVAADRTALRVRYTPALLADAPADGSEPGLRQLAAEPASAPERAIGAGMVVHLRRRPGLETLGYLFAGARPPELELAARACADIVTALAIAGRPIGRDHHDGDLLRISLGGELDGFIALARKPHDAASAGAVLEVAERGVLIARYTLPLAELGAPRAPVPVRLYIDGPSMPTSASRSEVRLDAHPIGAARARAAERFAALIDEVVTRVVAEPDGPFRDAALALLAPAVAGHDWIALTAMVHEPLLRLARLPLLRNALGLARAPAAGWRIGAVHVGREPLPAELGPWVENVLWSPPGDPAIRLFGSDPIDTDMSRRLVRTAREQQRAQARFERRPVRPAAVDPAVDHAIRIRLGARPEPSALTFRRLASVTGELCLRRRGRGGQALLLWRGRAIETVDIDCPLPFTAVVAIDGSKLKADKDYRFLLRDGAFKRLEAELSLAAVHAAEGLALARTSQALPDGFALGWAEVDDDDAARLLRHAFALAMEMSSATLENSPLFSAPIWPTVADGVVSANDLRCERAVGTLPSGGSLHPIRGRIVVEVEVEPGEAALLRMLLEPDVAVIDYAGGARVRPEQRAAGMAAQLAAGGLTALAIVEPGACGAIAWGVTERSVLVSFHSGRRLSAAAYKPLLAPCVVWADCDDSIPNAAWVGLDDRGADARSFVDWEVALARAVARTIAGDPVPELHRWMNLPLSASNAERQLWTALTEHDPDWLLGPSLRHELARQAVFTTLAGSATAAELAAAFEVIETVGVAPADSPRWPAGRAPVIADALVAHGLGRLVGKEVRDVSGEIAARARSARRDAKLAAHRERAPEPLALPHPTPEIGVQMASGVLRIGIGTVPGLDLTVHVEGRPFQRLNVAARWPLVAAIDLPAEAIDRDGEAIDPDVLRRIDAAAPRAVGRLLNKIARTDPTALADQPAICHLLADWLADARARGVHAELLAELATTAAFPTTQGGRASVKAAEFAYHISVARWSGEWLGPGDEPRHLLDRPILALIDGEAGSDRLAVIRHLAGERELDEVTDAVAAMQLERRMARGLVPRPTVHGADPALTRPLHVLATGSFVGRPGEIALVSVAFSRMIVHAAGRPIGHVAIDIAPPVAIAMEGGDMLVDGRIPVDTLSILRSDGQEMTRRLVREVTAASGTADLPAWLRESLRHALLARTLDPFDVHRAPLFRTTAGDWVGIPALEEQQQRLGSVWAARPGTTAIPLDPQRIAIELDRADITGAAFILGVSIVDANDELVSDSIARVNQARPPVSQLELDPSEHAGALAVVSLDGDGIHLPRGLVAALSPAAADLRGVRCHRGMVPLGTRTDPCAWPTLAVIDHVLTPDRTFSHPVTDSVWREVAAAIVEASERALRSIDPPPADALASIAIGATSGRSPGELRVVRGWLWLADMPGKTEVIVTSADRRKVIVPVRNGRPVPVSGWLVIHPFDTDRMLHDIDDAYRELLNVLATSTDALAAAHVAHGLALGVPLSPIGGLRFACFAPRPLWGSELVSLLAGHYRVPVIEPGSENDTDEPAVIDDGSPVAQVILSHLGRRARRRQPPARRPIPTPPAEHPLAPLAAELLSRLRRLGLSDAKVARVAIASGEPYPIARGDDRTLHLAGDNDLLRAIEADRLAGTAWSHPAIDALVAHALTVLRDTTGPVTEMVEFDALGRLLGGSQ